MIDLPEIGDSGPSLVFLDSGSAKIEASIPSQATTLIYLIVSLCIGDFSGGKITVFASRWLKFFAETKLLQRALSFVQQNRHCTLKGKNLLLNKSVLFVPHEKQIKVDHKILYC